MRLLTRKDSEGPKIEWKREAGDRIVKSLLFHTLVLSKHQ